MGQTSLSVGWYGVPVVVAEADTPDLSSQVLVAAWATASVLSRGLASRLPVRAGARESPSSRRADLPSVDGLVEMFPVVLATERASLVLVSRVRARRCGQDGPPM